MKSTVIIPTFNRTDYLSECLDCFLAQELKPDNEMEIIVVSDGCDATIEWFKESKYAKEPMIRIFNSHHSEGYGIRLCFNIGAKFSTGEQLIFMADDCLVESDYVQNHQEFFEPEMMLMGRIAHVHPQYPYKWLWPEDRFVFFPELVKRTGFFWDDSWEFVEDKVWGAELPLSLYVGATMSVCKETFMNMGGNDFSMREEYDDCELGHRWTSLGHGVKFICPLVFHKGASSGIRSEETMRVKGDNIVQINDEERMRTIVEIITNFWLVSNGGRPYFEGDWSEYEVVF